MNRLNLHRLILWTMLLLFAAWFLVPLYVMLTTSLKDAEQLRAGNLLSLPTAPTLDAWFKAWETACTGVQCEGLKPFFWNSVLMVVPAVAISTVVGALNGYAFGIPSKDALKKQQFMAIKKSDRYRFPSSK